MRRTRPVRSASSIRALRYGAGTSALVLLICAVIAGFSARTLGTVGPLVSAATARAVGEVVHSTGRTAEIRWSAPGAAPGAQRTDTVELAVRAPAVGTRTEVAYDPQHPATVLIPGSAELAAMDRAASGLAFSGLIATVVLGACAWQLISRRRLYRKPAQPVSIRRVRVQSGLLTRSWLELESPRPQWIPVHFDPVLVTLPAPAMALLHGELRPGGRLVRRPGGWLGRRLIGAEVDGIWLPPSGPVQETEPGGRRIDSPALPDADAPDRAAHCGWRRQLRADAALLVPAPVVGLLWAFLDGGGALTWACATALTAALALWWAALRGSDPS